MHKKSFLLVVKNEKIQENFNILNSIPSAAEGAKHFVGMDCKIQL